MSFLFVRNYLNKNPALHLHLHLTNHNIVRPIISYNHDTHHFCFNPSQMSQSTKLCVLAIGGNSLIRDKNNQDIKAQFSQTRIATKHMVTLIENGYTLVVNHGNGPQVGFGLRRAELAAQEVHTLPLEVVVSQTQGSIGYMIQQCLYDELRRRSSESPAASDQRTILDNTQVATIVTQVEVDSKDPAFASPTKPVGSFCTQEEAKEREEQDGWAMVQDAGRGWRRVVASPRPLRVVELPIVERLVKTSTEKSGLVVIAGGGGGVPVVKTGDAGELSGIAAVIDKDFTSSLMATTLRASLFLISTAIECVALHFGTPEQKDVPWMRVSDAKTYLESGEHFKKGSMAPKIEAAIQFLENDTTGEAIAIITDPLHLMDAIAGKTGTRITHDDYVWPKAKI